MMDIELKTWIYSFFIFALNIFQCNTDPVKETRLPNILILLSDDLGYHDLSCNGSRIYQTPQIDRLSSESVSFSQAYANYPRCVPSRYAIMTGKYPVKDNGVPEGGFDMHAEVVNGNYINAFKQLGYHTFFMGKWHLGEGENSPGAFGYEKNIAAGKAGSPISYFFPFNTPKGHNKEVEKDEIIMNFSVPLNDGDYLTDKMTDELIGYLEQQKSSNKPFLAFASFYAVHQPLEAKKVDIERNKAEIASFDYKDQPEYIREGTGRTKMRQDHPVYAAMVENLDENVGKILTWLEENDLDKNTIVIFTSDHGGLSNDGKNKRDLATSNYPLRAGKGWNYEGGLKVPLLVKTPQKFGIQPSENESIVMLMDIFPTLAELLNANATQHHDGKSLVPVLKGKEIWDDRTVFWHSSKNRPNNTGEGKSSAVRSGRWKLIDFYEEGRMELYDLKMDPSEKNDLSEKNPEKVRELSAKLQNWKSSW